MTWRPLSWAHGNGIGHPDILGHSRHGEDIPIMVAESVLIQWGGNVQRSDTCLEQDLNEYVNMFL